MKDLNETYLDIDDLAKKIEKRIKELEEKESKKHKEKKYADENLGENIANLDEIIKEIDKRIQEIEEEEKFDIDDLTNKVNAKLASLDDAVFKEDDLEKTKYDLEDISRQINQTIKSLEQKRKERKRKKAMYCDMARKNAKKKNVSKKANKKD